MIIDSHVHAIAADRARYPLSPLGGAAPGDWVNAVPAGIEDLSAAFTGAWVDGAVVVQAASAYGVDSAYAVDCVMGRRDRYSAVCIVDMFAPDGGERLSYWVEERGATGLRVMATGSGDPERLDDPRSFPVWERARQLGITINVQMHNRDLHRLRAALDRYPEVPVAIDHLANYSGGPETVLSGLEGLMAFAAKPNVYLKFSTANLQAAAGAGLSSRRLLEPLVERFGAGRLIWGSNYPATHQPAYGEMARMAKEAVAFLSPADQVAVLGETAARLWKIGGHGPLPNWPSP